MSSAYILAGLGFGDEGKGTCTDALARREGASLVVRFNGGAQASHHVVLPDGRSHGFSQFGSGTFAGARTHLSRFMLVNPSAMLNEAEHLEAIGVANPFALVTVEREALVTAPMHIVLNRLREAKRGDLRHGSCGMGIGETVADSLWHPEDALRVQDLDHGHVLRRKLSQLLDRLRKQIPDRAWDDMGISNMTERMMNWRRRVLVVDGDWLASAMKDTTTIFEGAQGVLLDERWGAPPYTTWSDCTFGNAVELLNGFAGTVTKLGVTRAFSTRHGAGPFPTEDRTWAPAAAHDHNKTGPWQGEFRVGPLDLPRLRYAAAALGRVDGVCVTNLDRLREVAIQVAGGSAVAVCTRHDGDAPVYGLMTTVPEKAAGLIAGHIEAPLAMISTGPTYLDKRWLT